MELLLYNIYVIGYKYKSIREEEENNTYNLSAWENRKENIMADKKAIIDETQFEAQYDAEAKLLLAQKPFLANILLYKQIMLNQVEFIEMMKVNIWEILSVIWQI